MNLIYDILARTLFLQNYKEFEPNIFLNLYGIGMNTIMQKSDFWKKVVTTVLRWDDHLQVHAPFVIPPF